MKRIPLLISLLVCAAPLCAQAPPAPAGAPRAPGQAPRTPRYIPSAPYDFNDHAGWTSMFDGKVQLEGRGDTKVSFRNIWLKQLP